MATERDPLIVNGSNLIQDHRPPGPRDISRSTRYGILVGLWSATFLSSLNTTLVATLLPSISSDFNKSHEASWLGTSYLLAVCTFTPLYGRLCNIMGRRGANQLAVCITALGTLWCGFSTSMWMLVAARFLSGMGGGGILTTCTITTSDMYSMRSRGLAQGVQSVFNGLGMGLGGPIGGLISDRFGWRWAFLIQMPLFVLSLALTTYNLRYVTPGKSRNTRDVLKRIDYGGSFSLLLSVGSCLVFLSMKYNEDLPWSNPWVHVPLALACTSSVVFILVELLVSPEPIMAPFLLKQKVPVLVGANNFLVALCNFSVMYFFPMWFQTVALTSASTAGLHLMPNSVCMSAGSLFAGWMMHRTGKYKLINLIFGFFPFIGITLITLMREDSGPLQMWLSIVPLGFGNAVVLQTNLVALLAHLPESAMAVGTGFGQVFRGMGQVGGVAISSALFQYKLDYELRSRIHGDGAAEIVNQIRHSTTLVGRLPPDLQRAARESYAISLRAVFTLAACSTLLAYLVRLPIPEKDLDGRPKETDTRPKSISPRVESRALPPANGHHAMDNEGNENTRPLLSKRERRFSTLEPTEGTQDLESASIGGSARQR
ncbi:major facilitator superfamily domain-containing protein [Suillus subalutaceus]|uniref:major facilitator superfamily domain-containing protein n=1 Tax=Suillus subalutaceus TaxID=48586 RepID=UPI001B85DE99|nr:major facilitator superfamily domain-containing protein [Suillus subalutaceus]KAG1854788.1 major facilitator superfamily domain-containing protein [Suillus subalutaceus]